MMAKPIQVVVVDDHALFRAGLVSLLSQMPGIQVTGEGANGLEALALVKKSNPDLLLLDVNMPVMDGIEAVNAINKVSNCRILMLTISRRQEDLIGAIQAGADGYILKNAEPEELREAIRLAMEGKPVLSPEVTQQVMEVIRNGMPSSIQPAGLTPRELEIMGLLSKGFTNPQISKQLHISGNTVKTHVRKIMEKLGAATRTEAVRIAIQRGIIKD